MLNLPAISEVQLPKHFFALVVLVPSCSASSCGVSTVLHPPFQARQGHHGDRTRMDSPQVLAQTSLSPRFLSGPVGRQWGRLLRRDETEPSRTDGFGVRKGWVGNHKCRANRNRNNVWCIPGPVRKSGLMVLAGRRPPWQTPLASWFQQSSWFQQTEDPLGREGISRESFKRCAEQERSVEGRGACSQQREQDVLRSRSRSPVWTFL